MLFSFSNLFISLTVKLLVVTVKSDFSLVIVVSTSFRIWRLSDSNVCSYDFSTSMRESSTYLLLYTSYSFVDYLTLDSWRFSKLSLPSDVSLRIKPIRFGNFSHRYEWYLDARPKIFTLICELTKFCDDVPFDISQWHELSWVHSEWILFCFYVNSFLRL